VLFSFHFGSQMSLLFKPKLFFQLAPRSVSQIRLFSASSFRPTILRPTIPFFRSATIHPLFAPSFFSLNFSKEITPDQPGNLQETSVDLVKLIDEERDSIQLIEEKEMQEILDKRGFQIEIKEEIAYLRKAEPRFSVTLSFPLPNDEFDSGADEVDEQQDQEGEDGEKEEKEENEEGEEDKEEDVTRMEKVVSVQALIETKQGSKITAECAVSRDRNFYLENLRFDKEKKLWFSDLSQILQERMFDWMDNIGMDQEMGGFISDYIADYRSKSAHQSLLKLKSFVSEMALDSPAPKAKSGSKSGSKK